jgi:SAM-dependent methyltransferase
MADSPMAQRFAGRRIIEPTDEDPISRARARGRWTQAEPDVHLTWGVELSGQGFVTKLTEYASFTPESRLVEVGPGYGRLLTSILEMGLPFASYTGIDVSAHNIDHLEGHFDDERLDFVLGDVEATPVPEFDLAFSSLTLKHIYPDFAAAAQNIARSAAPEARFVFDVIEGSTSFFEFDEETFVRRYEREQIGDLLLRAGMEVSAWDVVRHDADVLHDRLLVVARPVGR